MALTKLAYRQAQVGCGTKFADEVNTLDGAIPQLEEDPASPQAEEAWALHEESTVSGQLAWILPHWGLTLTQESTTHQYTLQYRTQESTTIDFVTAGLIDGGTF